jgi:hypothetical protein
MLIILSKLSITLKHKNPNFTKIVSNFEVQYFFHSITWKMKNHFALDFFKDNTSL